MIGPHQLPGQVLAPFFLPRHHQMMPTFPSLRAPWRTRLPVLCGRRRCGLACRCGRRACRCGAAAPAGAAAAGAAAAGAGPMLDVNDFTTCTPDTWTLLDWDTIAFPSDPAINVASVRYYMAVAMILWYQADLREKHKRVWDELNYAWMATFSCDVYCHYFYYCCYWYP